MRPLETLLSCANVLALAALVIPRLQAVRWLGYVTLIAIVIAIVQMLAEGTRWQLVPIYILTSVFTLVWLIQSRTSIHWPALINWLGSGLGLLSLVIAIALPLIFPVFRIPHPTGSYNIGTVTYHWVDVTRPETFTADPDDHRELMVQVWYPARPDPTAARAPYIPQPNVLIPLARLLRLPDFIFEHLKYITTNAVPSASVAETESNYPVLIFSHGRGGYRQHNTLQIEELVSHGYIVAAIDHTYAASGVVFPDGRQINYDPRMSDRTFVGGVIPYLAQDAIFTLDQLAALNVQDPNGILTGKLDLQRTGIFGLSLGGEVTATACKLEPRFKACLIMDVWMPAEIVESGLQQPTLWISRDVATMQREGWSQADIDETQNTMQAAFETSPGDGYFIRISGMFHQDFSDAPLLSPLTSWLGLTGPINHQRAHAIVNAYSLAFFDQYLKDQPAALLSGPNDQYPEALFEKNKP